MKLSEIIAIASRAYPDSAVQAYFEDLEGQHGDTLAEFIVRELHDVHDANAGSQDQLSEAAKAIRRARDELDNVLAALEGEIERLG